MKVCKAITVLNRLNLQTQCERKVRINNTKSLLVTGIKFVISMLESVTKGLFRSRSFETVTYVGEIKSYAVLLIWLMVAGA